MKSRLGLKIALFFSLVVLSIYLLVPTYFNFNARREQAARAGVDEPWYVKLFPEKQINLGLDLQGGIYLELEVGLEAALKQRADIMSTALEKYLQENSIPHQPVSASVEGNEISVTLQDPAAMKKVRDHLQEVYGNTVQTLDDKSSDTVLSFSPSQEFRKKLKDDTLHQAVETIRNRIDRYGVTEPTIQRLGDNRVVVEIPGVQDPDRAIALVKRSGKLEFRIVDDSLPQDQLQALIAAARSENKVPEGHTLEIANQLNEALEGKLPSESEVVFEVVTDPVTKKTTGSVPYLLKKKIELSGDMLRNAQVNVDQNKPYVSLSFNPEGTKLFADLTAANIGKRLAILLDGTVNKAPQIQVAIPNGEAQITLGYGNYQVLMREAEDLTVVLREGALPATLTEVTKTVIGPSLGQSSIEKSFHATLLAALVVIVFMTLWYKKAGIVANVAVLANVLFLFAGLTLFGATLTLPGVAGIVLTIGMAVDANVVILERIKEELRGGRTVAAAVKAGYGNAIRAVVDANITTFLSGVVLYQFGTGPVRGFAVTLMVGIVTTLYTAVFLTKLYYDYRIQHGRITKLSL